MRHLITFVKSRYYGTEERTSGVNIPNLSAASCAGQENGLTQETAACHVLAPGSDFGFNHSLTVQVVRGWDVKSGAEPRPR